MKKWFMWLAVALIIITIIGGAGYLGAQSGQVEASDMPQVPTTVAVTRGDVQQTVTAPGQLVNTSEALLGFEASGQLAEITVRPGEHVKAGQVLAQLNLRPLEEKLETAQLELAQAQAKHKRDLDEAQLDLQIAKTELSQEKMKLPSLTAAEAALTAAQAELEEVLAGPDNNEITVAAADLRQAEIALKQAQLEYDQVAYLGDVGARPEANKLQEATLSYEAKLAAYNLAVQEATPAEIANARAKVQQAQAGYDQARTEQGVNGQQLAILEARVKKARLALEALQAGLDPALARAVQTAEEDLKAATLLAPFAGVILEVQAKLGETVIDRAGVILMADTTALEVYTKVIEEDLPLVQVGQPVEIFFDAVPEAAVRGQVARVVPQRISGEDRPLYPVYLSLDELPPNIISGMTADASIIIAEKANVLRLPRALVQADSEGIGVVEVWANNQRERREVQVGLRGDVHVEIVAGLSEEDEVVGQ
jgi:multidrug efflux pump subunit AcrA (membrane-fusion protein)